MPKRVLIDTNLLVLLIVGGTNIKYIEKHKNCTSRNYTAEDYNQLLKVALASAGIITTPHILSETSNLLRQIGDPIKLEITTFLKAYINSNPEIYIPSSTSADKEYYTYLGLSDAAILSAVAEDVILLTDDGPLYGAALSQNLGALHIEQIRAST